MTKMAVNKERVKRRRWVFLIAYPCYLAVLLYLGYRLFLLFAFDVPVARSLEPDEIWKIRYRELHRAGLLDESNAPDDEHFDVLLLGGSVAQQAGKYVQAALEAKLGDRLRFIQLATSGNTTQDSYLKFKRVGHLPYDLVVIYHGINDVRMNYRTDEKFKEYEQSDEWFESVETDVERDGLAMSEVRRVIQQRVRNLSAPETPKLPNEQLKVRSPDVFEAHLEFIAGNTEQRDIPVMLMTFQYYIPDDYTAERFAAGETDYGEGPMKMPIENWATPDVLKTVLDVHNERIADIAGRHGNAVPVDRIPGIPTDGKYFADVCHLTPEGCDLFAKNLLRGAEPIIAKWQSRRRGRNQE